jgi:hypothetical protein
LSIANLRLSLAPSTPTTPLAPATPDSTPTPPVPAKTQAEQEFERAFPHAEKLDAAPD